MAKEIRSGKMVPWNTRPLLAPLGQNWYWTIVSGLKWKEHWYSNWQSSLSYLWQSRQSVVMQAGQVKMASDWGNTTSGSADLEDCSFVPTDSSSLEEALSWAAVFSLFCCSSCRDTFTRTGETQIHTKNLQQRHNSYLLEGFDSYRYRYRHFSPLW